MHYDCREEELQAASAADRQGQVMPINQTCVLNN
jgi:hypothetical protein